MHGRITHIACFVADVLNTYFAYGLFFFKNLIIISYYNFNPEMLPHGRLKTCRGRGLRILTLKLTLLFSSPTTAMIFVDSTFKTSPIPSILQVRGCTTTCTEPNVHRMNRTPNRVKLIEQNRDHGVSFQP